MPGSFLQTSQKGFGLIDHTILTHELRKLEVHPALLSWIAAFLTDRQQAVTIGRTLSDWQTLKGGIPQGTKLGIILFTVMTNKLLSDWRLRIKFMDDTSAFEIIPRNSISLLNTAVFDAQDFTIAHNMKLNPTKCKEMLVNFLHNSNFMLRSIIIGSNLIERVTSYKILGVITTNDLSWNNHVEYITKKATKKLYSLRVLCRAGVEPSNILRVYLTTIRSVLEYAVPVWQNIPEYLSDAIETLQKRALKIIFPTAESYTEALQLAQLKTLAERRHDLCMKYMERMKCSDHPLNHLLPRPVADICHYNLRRHSERFYLYNNATMCRTKRTQSFFTFKYFD